ncbi:DUF2797 domain-containing protein [Brumimicrobium aurantiacum]|uniref:DUF2797 domain-containing protein n=1 Tax=Brumimicrobium aurantiacum TaxID=1737063 RepID=A0A3E1EYW7_9FLAO|nr:DUF2797 domain-containing protein [Brumimicrobium aurantiacum]RFC54752.1 DUF2797 domain-containing protein [Brumimicrobium aurantiacum]
MNIKGELRKMNVSLDDENNVHYQLKFHNTKTGEEQLISANELIGKRVNFQFEGNIFCKKCGKKTKTSFNQGFCYTCFKDAPESAECIIRPELCKAHLGEGRDVEWEERNHNQPHVVYLAASDVIKVGVTRETQIPTRWIDQGANEAIQLAETPNRYLAGVLEVALKSQFTDKTNWRKMLRNEVDENIDLEETKWELEEALPEDLAQYITDEDEVTDINYPVIEYPVKIKSVNLDKLPEISGTLKGIKGQYFILDGDRVMNIRRHTSYEVEFSIEN